jgi:diguanylate cyclase (GGDEF)-like protein
MKDIAFQEALALLDVCPVAMLVTGVDGSIRGHNQAFTALVGAVAETLPADLLAPLLGQGTLVDWIMPDGDQRWLAVEMTTIGDAPGSSARFYIDVTEKLQLRKERDTLADKLRKQALRDEQLTGLLSRHGVLVSLEPLVARSRRYNSPLSVVVMGIQSDQDRDQMLTRVAFLLRDQTRWADLVGCTDTHDFIMILQETTTESALQLVEKLAAQIEHMNASSDKQLLACYGITQCQKNDDVESILERAEAALAEARDNESCTSITL